VLLRPSVVYGSHQIGLSFSSFANPDGLLFASKTITTKELSFHVGESVRFLRPSISIDKKIDGLKWLYLNAGYHLSLHRQNTISLKDESGFFLFRGERSTSLDASGAVVTSNGQPLPSDPKWFSPLYLEVGVRWSF
ncbi:MAG: hypothetical protein ORN54_09190, partial [Cyclobacteriaceae bacterium]|nr:hypothetical protein [Cyclobacteriaceae bacterium]